MIMRPLTSRKSLAAAAMWLSAACLALPLAACSTPQDIFQKHDQITGAQVRGKSENAKWDALNDKQKADVAAVWNARGTPADGNFLTPAYNLDDPRICSQVPAACTRDPVQLPIDDAIKVARILNPENWPLPTFSISQRMSELSAEISRGMSLLSSLTSQVAAALAQSQQKASMQAPALLPAADKASVIPERNGSVRNEAIQGYDNPITGGQQIAVPGPTPSTRVSP